MAECIRCHLWCPRDPETGYDADGVCNDCQAQGYHTDSTGVLYHDDDDYFFDRMDDDNRGEY